MGTSCIGLYFIILLVLQAAWSLRICSTFARNRARILISASTPTNVGGSNVQSVRSLGAYEKLLSRQVPGASTLALSHGCRVALNSMISGDELHSALVTCIERHPMLRVYIHYPTDVKEPAFSFFSEASSEIASKALLTEEFICSDAAVTACETYMTQSVNGASFSPSGPLWRLNHIKDITKQQSSLIFTFNHGIDDQRSVNIVIADVLYLINSRRSSAATAGLGGPLPFPPSIESAVSRGLSFRTIWWALFQIRNGQSKAVVLPDHLTGTSAERSQPSISDPNQRKTVLRHISLSAREVNNIKAQCRRRGLSVTHLLNAAVSTITARYITSTTTPRDITIRILLSVGLRSYHKNSNEARKGDFTEETVACASGAVDYVLKCPELLILDNVNPSPQIWETLFALAKQSQEEANFVLEQAAFVPESVTLMDIGFRTVDILQAVELDAKNKNTLGRGYTCGVSNMGVVDFVSSSSKPSDFIEAQPRLQVKEIYYATSHGRNGNLCQLSCMTVAASGDWYGCLQFPWPIVTEDEADSMRNSLMCLLRAVAALS